MTRVVQIGDATLYRADCRDVVAGWPPRSVEMIFTDPPYGHNNNNDGDLIANREAVLGRGPAGPARPIMNDGKEDANNLARWLFAMARDQLSGGCCCCCCCSGGGGPDPQFARWSLWLDELLGFKQMIVWDKGRMGMGWHYRRSYEFVLVGEKPGAACKWYDKSGSIENIIRPGAHGVRRIVPAADQHPTPKPWHLAAHFIRLHTQPGDVVFDPFMGAGSTGEAALRLGRKFIGIELDPHWYGVACNRLRAVTGEDAGELFGTPKLTLFEAGGSP